MATIEERLNKIIADLLYPEKEITRESELIDDLGADSLDMVEIIMAVEEDFGMEITDDEAENLTTFGALVDYVTKATGQ